LLIGGCMLSLHSYVNPQSHCHLLILVHSSSPTPGEFPFFAAVLFSPELVSVSAKKCVSPEINA